MSRHRLIPTVLAGQGETYGPLQTLTLQPDATAGVDTMMQSNAATTNYATDDDLYVGKWASLTITNRALIKFDLSSIPANALIVSATITLKVKANSGFTASGTMSAYRQLRAWVEAQTTWNVYSTGNSWATAGGFGATDCEQTGIGSVVFASQPAADSVHTLSLTAAKVQEWVDGTLANNGVLLKMETELDNDLSFCSSDHATAGNRPKLEVVYRVPFESASVRSHVQLADAPIAADQMGFEECSGLLYWVAGRAAAAHSQKVYAYNPATNQWTERADYPIAVQSLALRAVGGKLYGIGGHNSQTVTFYDDVYEYDPAENTWTEKTAMPTPREDFGSAVIGTKIYCFGGLTTGYTATKALEIYDTEANTWDATKAEMPDYKMEGDFGCSYDGIVYAIGCTNTFAGYPVLSTVKACYKYTPVSNTWEAIADIPLGTCYKEVVALGTKLYVVSGAVSNTTGAGVYSRHIYEYDTVGNTWTLKNAAFGAPYETAGSGLAVYGANIYMCGGVEPDNTKRDDLYRLVIGA